MIEPFDLPEKVGERPTSGLVIAREGGVAIDLQLVGELCAA